MRIRRKLFFALAVAFMMMAVAVPVQNGADTYAGDIRDDDTTWLSAEDSKVTVEENKNGSYSIHIPILEERFGMKTYEPDPDDPYMGTMGIKYPEIHSFYGSNDRNEIILYKEGYEVNGPRVTSGMTYGTEFAVGFSKQYQEFYIEDIFTIGLTTGGQWFVQNTTNTDIWKMPEYDNKNAEYLENLRVGSAGLMKYQSANLFPYAVGDFVEDDRTEEFAVYLGNTVDVFNCADYDGNYMWPSMSFQLPADPYSGGYGVNPVSMAAGDIDRDGVDEIAVVVEYSADHSSPVNCSYGEHCSYLYLLDPDDPSDVKMSRLGMSIYNDYYGVTEHLDTVMTSVVATDYDFDGKAEFMLGGYMWDNSNRSHDACSNPNYFTGELFLGAVEPSTVGTDMFTISCVNRLMDDAGDDPPKVYQRTMYDLPATNGDHTKGRDYNNHSEKDTSIMLDDWSDNAFGYCRSPNWLNWTVPMAAVHFKSFTENPYIYLDNTVYKTDSNGDATFFDYKAQVFNQDNNNCMCVNIGTGAMHYRDDTEYFGFEDLYRLTAMDRQDNDGGCQYWVHNITMMDDDFLSVGNYTTRSYAHDEWSDTEPLMGCLADRDTSDRVSVEYLGVCSGISDPKVIAAISEIPYDEDLPVCLTNGTLDIGSTSYYSTQSHSEENGSTVDFQLDFAGALDLDAANFRMDGKIGYNFCHDWSNTHTMSVTYESEKSEDAVTVYIMPYDVYSYLVNRSIDYVDTTYTEEVIRWHDPLQVTFSYESYCTLIEQYNQSMTEFAKERNVDFQPLNILPPFDHTAGDIMSYDEEKLGTDVLTEQPIQYSGEGKDGYETVTVELTDSSSVSDMHGGNGNIRVVGSILLDMVELGADVALSGGDIKTTVDMTGMGFSSRLTSGLYQAYNWEKSEAEAVMSQYGMTGHMWAVNRMINDNPYVYVGYTVDTCTSACKSGWIAPDKLIPNDQDDVDNDGRNPGADYLYLQIGIPGDVREHLMGEKYVLQMRFQTEWYDFCDLTGDEPGVVFQVETGELDANGDPVLEDLTGPFYVTPGKDQTFWVKVSNFYKAGGPVHEFRLMGYDADGNPHPSIATEAETYGVSNDLVQVTEFRLSDRTVFVKYADRGEDCRGLRLMTDLAPGTIVNIMNGNVHGTFDYHGQSVVGSDGDVSIVFWEKAPPEKEPVPLSVTLIVFAGILVCLGVGAHLIRRP